MINSYLVRKLKGILLQGRLHEEVILAMEGKSQTSGYGGIGRRTGLKILGYYYRESSNLSIRIAKFKGLRCNKTLFVWMIAFII